MGPKNSVFTAKKATNTKWMMRKKQKYWKVVGHTLPSGVSGSIGPLRSARRKENASPLLLVCSAAFLSNTQTNKQSSKQSKQASKQASTQAGKQTSKQTNWPVRRSKRSLSPNDVEALHSQARFVFYVCETVSTTKVRSALYNLIPYNTV